MGSLTSDVDVHVRRVIVHLAYGKCGRCIIIVFLGSYTSIAPYLPQVLLLDVDYFYYYVAIHQYLGGFIP